MEKLKKMDFYRRVPIDLTEPTAPGAIISLFCVLLMITLFFGEVISYFSPNNRSDMFVAQEVQGTRLRVNFNMTYHKLPCFALSLDVLDVLGRHEVGVGATMQKTRVSRDFKFLSRFVENENEYQHQTSEGCNVAGYVTVNKVPGNWHVSAHGTQHYVQRFLGGNLNVQHTIHSLWFGDLDISVMSYEGEVAPLNGHQQLDAGNRHHEYYLDIVPTHYKRGRAVLKGYQFSVNSHSMDLPPGHMAAVWFRYQLSPITVQFGTESTSFLHFLTYVCAIIGGVFTVAGILSRSIHQTAVQFQKRVLGKGD